uniref:Nitrate transporter 2 n=1 Tax=Bangia sp. ESS1 TaxID=2651159 RepID=A0A7S7YGP5_9RHOD|nr:nitrate transporter 2 [Bangia sp. ESS1]
MSSRDSSGDVAEPVAAPSTTRFSLPVDEKNRATKLIIWQFNRPHMRAFHFAWSSFFLAFFGWFALAPLLPTIKEENDWLNDDSALDSNIIGVAGTVMMRFVAGPVCDRFGPRITQTTLLTVFSIPVFLVGTANSFATFALARFFIGFIGAAFVVTQAWTSIMFAPVIVGTANATSAGWGNLGGGVTNAIMPLIFKGVNAGLNDPNKAWRVAQVIPGIALVLSGVALFFLSDDCPDGNYQDLIKAGTRTKTNPWLAFFRASKNYRSWVLFALYAACFGVELIMNGNLASYFKSDVFGLSQSVSGLIAGLFGLMNLFARSIGGIASDGAAKKYGMRGRLWAFFIILFLESLALIAFSRIGKIGIAIPVLIIFSSFVQMAEGATFGIVPFVDPEATGAVSGIVGAGGNVGAVTLSFLLKIGKKQTGFLYLGFVVLGASFLVHTLYWPQYGSTFRPATTPPVKVVEDEADVQDEYAAGPAPIAT